MMYFSCAEGHTANFAPCALRRIGALSCADIVARALRTVSSRAIPEDQQSREQLIEALDDAARAALESLDEEFLGGHAIRECSSMGSRSRLSGETLEGKGARIQATRKVRESPPMPPVGIDHVQVAMPRDREVDARGSCTPSSEGVVA
jgi:hypothetical protein